MKSFFSKCTSKNSGFSLVEVLLASSLLVIIVLALGGTVMYGQESTRLSGERARATFLAEEALEAVRNIRDDDFANLVDGTHGLQIIGNQWEFSGTNDQTDSMFTRSVTISTIDQYRKEVVATVSWQQTVQRSGTVVLQMYLTDWQRAVSVTPSFVIDTTNAHFANGNKQLDGITLENTGTADITIDTISIEWGTSALLTEIKIDGTKVWNDKKEGSPNGKQSSPALLDIVDFTLTPGSGILNLDYFKFDGSVLGSVFDIVFTLTDGSEYPVTVDFSSGGGGGGGGTTISPWELPTTSGIYNTPNGADGNDVFVVGTTAYMVTAGTGSDFYVIDVSTLTAPTITSSLELNAGAEALTVSGNTAFIASRLNNQELQNVDISATPTIIGGYDKPRSSNANAIAVSGSTAFLGTNSTGGNPGYEFYVIDVSNPTNPSFLGGLKIDTNVNAVEISGNYAYLAIDDTASEVLVVDISNTASPTVLTSIDLPNNSNGTALFLDGSYLYAGKGATTLAGEFYIIDITTPSSPVILNPTGFEVDNTVTDIFVDGTRAFVTIENTTNGLQIIDISVPAVPSLIGAASFAGIPTSVFVLNNVAFITTDNRNQELVIVEPQ